MQEKKEGASPEAQVLHHAKKFLDVREQHRAAKRARDPVKVKAASNAEYKQGLEFDKAVRRLPP